MIGRIAYPSLAVLGFVFLSSVGVNDCNDQVADGKKEGDTIVSRIAGLDRYYSCEHVDTLQHAGGEWEWVWECEAAPRLVPDGSWYPLDTKAIDESRWLRLVAWMEPWHELVLGLAMIFVCFTLTIRILPDAPADPSP